MKKIPHKKQQAQMAFTLIELMITTAITSIILITVTGLFITFLASSYKIRLSQSVRESGNQALQSMVTQLRNAHSITNCQTGSITFTGPDDQESTFFEENDQIASSSALNGTYYLTNGKTGSNSLENLEFHCYPEEAPIYVQIDFSLFSGNSNLRSLSSSRLEFNSGVTLRNN
ncbi:hypothetical protein SDC9_96797 [bioreactor metagenome]|jgi:type II secretory pathway pseudopilin PulG|uniref:Prepilin-type N-terminal cleavage/methylation domain-containing protein n=1 Tax=bioreactor metagenome TaxID=1076179 RepID=A0A645AGU3_9ZZZZ